MANVAISDRAILGLENLEIIDDLMTFEAPYLEEKLLLDGVFASKEEYDHAFQEFKRYAALCKLFRYNPLGMPSPIVDEVWHSFILFTKNYHDFCSRFLGGYMHHSPHTSHTPTTVKRKGVKNFVHAYHQVFGEIPAIWNLRAVPNDCSADMCGADQCGGCGNQCSKCD